METEIIEINEIIATRQAPGDRWLLVGDKTNTIHPSLTDALQAWFEKTGEKAEFRLAPLDSKLYVIKTNEIDIPIEPIKRFNIYGDPQ